MQPGVDYAPKGLCSVSQVNLISTAASGALAVVTMLTTPIGENFIGTQFWKVIYLFSSQRKMEVNYGKFGGNVENHLK